MWKSRDFTKIREKIFKRLFLLVDRLLIARDRLKQLCRIVLILSSAAFILGFVYYIGFELNQDIKEITYEAFRFMLLLLAVSLFLPELLSFDIRRFYSRIPKLILFVVVAVVIIAGFLREERDIPILKLLNKEWVFIVVSFIIILSEVARSIEFLGKLKIRPGIIFAGSFFILTVIGSGLLILPNAHRGEITYLDAFFTSVSAVCVTGLTVLNTSSDFTMLGQIIILCLIQAGGLGIMTFTGIFSYIFSAGTSFREKLMLKEFLSSDSLGSLFKILLKILLFTFTIEASGAFIIYLVSGENIHFRAFFAIFHSVSAFCNAGFSTLPEGLLSKSPVMGNGLLFMIAILVIIGGLGFPVILKIYSYSKHAVIVMGKRLLGRKNPVFTDRFTVGNHLAVRTTIILLLAGLLMYYLLEGGNTNAGVSLDRSLINSFFNSVTARTAGFNIVNLTELGYPAVFLTIFLMWIGASPGSTGGGIKTTTFSLALKDAWCTIRGRNALETHNREISTSTISRVLSIIVLSILGIASGFFILLLTESGKDPVHLLFDSVSAFSTVGLSLADPATFSTAGKFVIILLMFTGRIGFLTLLMSLFMTRKTRLHSYPEGEVYIN